MKRITILLLTSILMLSAVACSNAKTSSDAPDSTQESPQNPKADEVQKDQKDAQSQVRRDQFNSDIKAREERNNITGGDAKRADGDLESEVRSKLEANIPNGQLTVKAEKGVVTVAGTVQKQEQLAKIEPLAKQIKGVQKVNVKATVAPAKP
jgi:hyperosmotically inducible protein